jgi:hypothetical protein
MRLPSGMDDLGLVARLRRSDERSDETRAVLSALQADTLGKIVGKVGIFGMHVLSACKHKTS